MLFYQNFLISNNIQGQILLCRPTEEFQAKLQVENLRFKI